MPHNRPEELQPPTQPVVDDETAQAVFVGALRPSQDQAWQNLDGSEAALARAAISRAAEVRTQDGDIAADRLLEGVALILVALGRQHLINKLRSDLDNLPSAS